VLLIVMTEAGTWHAEPGQNVTFGRGRECTIKLPAGDHGLSRSAGSLSFHDGAWWLRNDSSSSMLYLSGDRGSG
jgi:predicted component of type VI protein secretion system